MLRNIETTANIYFATQASNQEKMMAKYLSRYEMHLERYEHNSCVGTHLGGYPDNTYNLKTIYFAHLHSYNPFDISPFTYEVRERGELTSLEWDMMCMFERFMEMPKEEISNEILRRKFEDKTRQSVDYGAEGGFFWIRRVGENDIGFGTKLEPSY